MSQVTAEALTERANRVVEKQKEERLKRREERAQRFEPLLQKDTNNLIHLFESQEMTEAIDAAVEKGYDSAVLIGSGHYNPGRHAPSELTYLSPDGAEAGDKSGVPIATLRRGVYNRKTNTSDPNRLPGKKTSIQRLNDYLREANGMYAVPRSRAFKTTDAEGNNIRLQENVVDIVWDLEHYEARMERAAKRRQEYRASRARMQDA